MEINQEIIDRLEKSNIDIDEGLLYLIGTYFNLRTQDIISEQTMKQVNFSKIITRDYSKTPHETVWNIPLFAGAHTEDFGVWSWVLEWREMFMRLKEGAGGDRKDCISKMKRYFAANPDVRKEEVFKAADLYLDEFRNSRSTDNLKYLQAADYFISKLVKTEGSSQKRSRLDQYIEIVRRREQQKNHADERFTGGLVS